MAHLTCQRGQYPFHGYQLPKLSNKSHGAVSEYEPLNIPHKLHTEFIADAVTPDDFIPLIHAPVPSGQSVLQTDPELCVTPDKSNSVKKNLKKHSICPRTVTPSPPLPDPSLSLTPVQTTNTLSRIPLKDKIPAVPTLIECDSNLAITPEKPTPQTSRTKSSLRTEKNEPEVKNKIKQKVRFDIDTSTIDKDKKEDATVPNADTVSSKVGVSKIYQPELYAGNDNDFVFENKNSQIQISQHEADEHRAKFDEKVVNKRIVHPAAQKKSTLETEKKRYSSDSESRTLTADVIERPDHVIPNTNNASPKRKVVVTREFQERPVITEYQFPFNCEDVDSDVEHVFSRPEFHNTLKVYSEIKEIGSMVPDVATAVKKHLQETEEKRTEISEKASSKVNQKQYRTQFSGLVGLEAPIEDLCHKTEKQITLKAQPVKHVPQKVSANKEPDLMEFFHADLEKEAPDFHLTSMTTPSEGLETAPLTLTFDLYRHNRVWEDIAWT